MRKAVSSIFLSSSALRQHSFLAALSEGSTHEAYCFITSRTSPIASTMASLGITGVSLRRGTPLSEELISDFE